MSFIQPPLSYTPRLRRRTVCSNVVQSITSSRSFEPVVNRTCSVPRTRPGWSPFCPAIRRASSKSISRSMVMVPSLVAGDGPRRKEKRVPHIYVLRSSDRPENSSAESPTHARSDSRACEMRRAISSRGKLNNGDPLPPGGETEFPGMEEARADALEVAQEADAPPQARAEDAPALIPRGH